MKEFGSPKQNLDMKIDERLRQADPARNPIELDEGLVLRAANKAADNKAAGRSNTNAAKALNARRITLGLSGLVTAVAVATAVIIELPGSQAIKSLPTSEAFTQNAGSLPVLPGAIRFSPFGKYLSPQYNSWNQALSIPSFVAGAALITKNVAFSPTESLLKQQPTVGTVYQIKPSETVVEAGTTLAALFGLDQPLKISKPHKYGAVTVTVGRIPSTLSTMGVDQPNSQGYRGFAAFGSKTGISWVYGNSRAMAWRTCRPGDSLKINVSMISRGGAKGQNNCKSLPSGLGPTKSDAIERAKLLFKSLGYKTGNTPASTPNGGLYLVAHGFDDTLNGRPNYYQATVSGYLKVAGQVTTLAQNITFTSSSNRIVSAQGFIGNYKARYSAQLKSPAVAVGQISVFNDSPDSMALLDIKNPGSYVRSDLSTSITRAPTGSPTPRNDATAIVHVSRYKILPGVIEAYDGQIWLIPTYEFTDKGGYLGAVKALPISLLSGVPISNK